MHHQYNDLFFNYIESGSTQSASKIVPIIIDLLQPQSILDVGCGRGAWCSQWIKHGVAYVVGVDGDYVDVNNLLITKKKFYAHDLSLPFDLHHTFDLVVSLEVAEHIQEESAEIFIDNITTHGSVVLFSAAPPGQAGEFHVNEQPLDYWRDKFEKRDFTVCDVLRPQIYKNKDIEPWYRNNTLLYVHKCALSSLRKEIRDTILKSDEKIPSYDSMLWSMRKNAFKFIPYTIINKLSHLYHYYKLRTSRGE